MSETATKKIPAGTFKGLAHLAMWHVVSPLALEYVIVYVLTGVISNTLLHQAFSQPAMALGVMAGGLLVRNFTRPKQPQQPQLVMPATLTPADLASIREAADKFFGSPDDRQDSGKATPYL